MTRKQKTVRSRVSAKKGGKQVPVRLTEALIQKLKREMAVRKKIEQELIASQSLLENIIRSSLDVIIATNTKQQIIVFNRAAEQAFGYSGKEAMGKPIELLYDDPGQARRITGKVYKTGSCTTEITSKRKNGQRFISYLSASLIKDSNGNVLGAMGVSRDITTLKKNEKNLRDSEKRYRDLVENSQVLICTHNMAGIITSINPVSRKWLGYKPEEMINRSVRDFLSTRYRHEFGAYLHSVRTRKRITGIMRVQTKSGEERFWHYRSSLRRNNRERYVNVFLEDITEMMRAQKQISDSLQEKEVLLKEVHHRVKNNLQVISSILNLQSSYIEDTETLNIFRESQDRIKAMAFIHESLYLSDNLSMINFSEYLYNLSDNLIRSYGVAVGSVEINTRADGVFLNLEAAIPCGLIIQELVSNALKYAFPALLREGAADRSGNRRQITVFLKTDKTKAHLIVQDNGIGLPADVDFRNTTTLGLQIVVALVAQLGGTIAMKRKRGTEYRITFNHAKQR